MAGKHHPQQYKDEDESVRSFLAYLFRDDGRRSPFPYCVNIEDGMDGFVVHHPDCRMVGQGASGGSDCIGGGNHSYRGPVQEWERRKN